MIRNKQTETGKQGTLAADMSVASLSITAHFSDFLIFRLAYFETQKIITIWSLCK